MLRVIPLGSGAWSEYKKIIELVKNDLVSWFYRGTFFALSLLFVKHTDMIKSRQHHYLVLHLEHKPSQKGGCYKD